MTQITQITEYCSEGHHFRCDGDYAVARAGAPAKLCVCGCHGGIGQEDEAPSEIDAISELFTSYVDSVGEALSSIFAPMSEVLTAVFGPILTELEESRSKIAKLEAFIETPRWTAGWNVPSRLLDEFTPFGAGRLAVSPEMLLNAPRGSIASKIIDDAVAARAKADAVELESRLRAAERRGFGVAEVTWDDGSTKWSESQYIPTMHVFRFPSTAAFNVWLERQHRGS